MKKITTLLVTLIYSYSIYAILPKSSYALPAYSTNKHDQIIEYERYTVSYNTKYRIPNWVAWELEKEHTFFHYSILSVVYNYIIFFKHNKTLF